jgi:hypothetical protein
MVWVRAHATQATDLGVDPRTCDLDVCRGDAARFLTYRGTIEATTQLFDTVSSVVSSVPATR